MLSGPAGLLASAALAVALHVLSDRLAGHQSYEILLLSLWRRPALHVLLRCRTARGAICAGPLIAFTLQRMPLITLIDSLSMHTSLQGVKLLLSAPTGPFMQGQWLQVPTVQSSR